jgi:probable rRNA maturation factor
MDPASTSPAQAGNEKQPELVIADPGWRRAVPHAEAVAARAARAALEYSQGDYAGGPLHPSCKRRRIRWAPTVVLSGDRAVQRLNARDRGRNKPTNVLTYDPPAPGLPGQIILALGVVRREAATASRRPEHHLAHLVIHGALHLAGYDHRHAGEARRMELAETRILHRLGIPNPWKHA